MGKSKKGKADSKPAADGAVKEEIEAPPAAAVPEEKVETPAEETASAKTEVAAEGKGEESKAEADGSSAEGAALVEEAEKVAAEGSKAGGSENEEKKEEEGQDEPNLYPMEIRGPSGEKTELQVAAQDTILDLKQFLLELPEVTHYTHYDLIVNLKDGLRYQLADFQPLQDVISEKGIEAGGAFLEVVQLIYEDRQMQFHVSRSRELLTFRRPHRSLSSALQREHEKRVEEEAKAGGPKDDEVDDKLPAELVDGLGFAAEEKGTLEKVVTEPEEESVPDAVKSIAYSAYNPPPSHRRIVGDLVYLDVVTVEGESLCITGHSQGFFVNKTELKSGQPFNPEMKNPELQHHTLVGLLSLVSPKAKENYEAIHKQKLETDQFELFPLTFPVNQWVGGRKPREVAADPGRAEEAMVAWYATSGVNEGRDFNEDLQGSREISRETRQERINRDINIRRVNADFVDTAIKGVKQIVRQSIAPINGHMPEAYHMWVQNGIVFGYALDHDFLVLQRLRQKQEIEKKDAEKEGRTITRPPPSERGGGDGPSLEETEDNSPEAEAKSPGRGLRAGGMLQAEKDCTSYASANANLRGHRAVESADVPGVHTLAYCVVDYKGHRLVAQSVLPGLLYSSKTAELKYGSPDLGETIKWDKDFHEKIAEVGKKLHIAEHSVVDGAGKAVELAAGLEVKGVLGADGRKYLTDLHRVTPRDVNYKGVEKANAVLRPELISMFAELESEKATELKGKGKEGEKADATSVALHPSVFSPYKLGGDKEEIEKAEDLVRRAGEFLVKTQIPKLVAGIHALEVLPLDGQTLTASMHAFGINIRYLGKVAELSERDYFRDLCFLEMISRVCKRVFRAILRETGEWDLAPAIAHYLNCVVGKAPGPGEINPVTPAKAEDAPKKNEEPEVKEPGTPPRAESPGKKKKGKKGQGKDEAKNEGSEKKEVDGKKAEAADGDKAGAEKSEEIDPALLDFRPVYMKVTGESIWGDVEEGVWLKYKAQLPEGTRERVRKLSLLRNLCQKMGISIAARDYDFDVLDPLKPEDILDLHPMVKHTDPTSSEARTLLEAGKLRLQEQSDLQGAFELLNEAANLFQNVHGAMSKEVAQCCKLLAVVLFHAEDFGGAIAQGHKELILNERILGLDHPDTIHSYGNLASYYRNSNVGTGEASLRHLKRALELLAVVTGQDHPEVASTMINIAMHYHELGRYGTALRYLQEALKLSQKLLGDEHVQTAVCLHTLALVFDAMGNYKLAIRHETSTYTILKKVLGEDEQRVLDSATFLRQFKQKDAEAQQRKNNPLLSPSVAQVALRQQQLQAAIQRAGGYTQFMKQYERQAAEAQPRVRRGVDERTVKAQEEIRRKAQARGVGQNRAEPGKMSFEELLRLISEGGHNLKHQGPPPAGGAAKGAAGKKAGGPTGLGALGAAGGLGVGLGPRLPPGGGAGSSAPPTPKAGKESVKKPSGSVPASPNANGGAAAPPQAPQGLGGGLDLPGKGKGKAKAKKSKD